jgi:cytochrome P450
MEIQRAANIFPGSAPHAALTDLTFEGYYIPKGTLVQPFIGSVMQNPKDFPNPSKFDPERFLDSKGNFVPNPKVPFCFLCFFKLFII